jgi:hypothetical protein
VLRGEVFWGVRCELMRALWFYSLSVLLIMLQREGGKNGGQQSLCAGF